MSSPVQAIWAVTAVGAPSVRRHCPRCDVQRSFASTSKFRVNGHSRRVDVWLIYACPRCGFRWKLTVFTRTLPSRIGLDRYRRFEDNDPAEALAVATDAALLAAAGGVVEPTGFTITGPDASVLSRLGPVCLRLRCAVPVRLDRLLCQGLGLSRGALRRLHGAGGVVISPDNRARVLRKPARPEQRILLKDAALGMPRHTPQEVNAQTSE